MRFSLMILLSFVFLLGCNSEQVTVTANGEPSHITVQHCLIGFFGSTPGRNVTRSKEEAAKLAAKILDRARSGEDFGQLIKTYTDDSPPGIYRMANHGFPGKSSRHIENKVFRRDGMVPAFGDVGFELEVGEFGLSEYSKEKSKYGWHIIKRIK